MGAPPLPAFGLMRMRRCWGRAEDAAVMPVDDYGSIFIIQLK